MHDSMVGRVERMLKNVVNHGRLHLDYACL